MKKIKIALKIIGKKIEKHVKESLHSKEEIAELAEIDVNTLNSYIKGGKMSLDILLKICYALNINPIELFNHLELDTPVGSLSRKNEEKKRITAKMKKLISTGFFNENKLTSDICNEINKEYNTKYKTNQISSIVKRVALEHNLKVEKIKGLLNFSFKNQQAL